MVFKQLMNNTKWEELRASMLAIGEHRPMWRTKDVETGYECPWDGEWFYHFRIGGYDKIEWMEIRIDSAEQAEAVLSALKKIHVPGHPTELGFKVYGYSATGIDYIE